MKNIHVLPTEKPSKLRVHECGQLFLSINFIYEINDENKKHIYITSDEEIKEGDWFIGLKNQMSKATSRDVYGGYERKIILTTDQDLIKNGVQAIDDEFLEWFVKNPSCESVEVKKWFDTSHIDLGIGKVYHNNPTIPLYKIIIPKEEPKQETSEEAADLWSVDTNNVHPADSYIAKKGFLEGAKFQAERMYSEEDLKQAFKQARQAKIFEKDMLPVWESWEQYYNETFKR